MKCLARFCLLLACVAAPARLPAQFVDKAQTAGVDLNFPAVAGGHTDINIDAYSVGNPTCAVDIDGDGWTDLIVGRAGGPCLVFMNQRNGTFREEASARGLDGAIDIGGIGAGDLSNTGRADIIMVPVHGNRQYLFLNDGTGRFREAAVERGVDATVTEVAHQGQSVSLADYDKDGFLDILISEWTVASNSQNALHSVLLHNKGKTAPGFFENRTAFSGLTQPARGALTANYASGWADFDGDGYPDLYIAGDYGTSQLWWNNADGTFTNGTDTSNINGPYDGMGLALFDYNGDGKIDIFVSAITLTNAAFGQQTFISDNKLFSYAGGRTFLESSVSAKVKETSWGWGAQHLDANNDGWPDLVVTNGYIGPGPGLAPAKVDPTKLLLNNTSGVFGDASTQYGITDNGLGRSVAILDYDNDGKEDILITQSEGHRFLYHNENTSGAHFLNLRFVGTTSNRDGYGAEVTITAGGRNQTALYNPTNSYIGQREPRLHFGLGTNTTVSKVSIKWPSGTVQELTGVSADQTLTVTESSSAPTAAPSFATQPADTSVVKDGTLVLSAIAQGSPAPLYNWFKDGVRIAGQTSATLTLGHILPIDAGVYTVTATNPNGTVTSRGATVSVTANLASKSVARWWNEALIDAIRKDTPNPPVHGRNLYHLSATLWDSFWAYEKDGWATRKEIYVKESPTLPAAEADRITAQNTAMSYAAYTVIKARYALSPGKLTTIAGIRWLMQQYGLNPDFNDATGNSAASTGLRIGQQVLSSTILDGANEAGNYADASGFVAANPPLVVRNPGVGSGVNPDFWQPLDLVNTITQNGIVLGAATQKFVGSNAKNTKTFALVHAANGFLVDDPGPPPLFNGSTKSQYLAQATEVLTYSSQLGTADGATLDISPGKLLNNPLGTNGGRGHATNPVTGKAYAGNIVLRGDYARVLAEFWADGPNSETPPGHWNVLFNELSDNPLCTYKFLGKGTALRRLEWDVCGYLALNGALHDAASAAWTLKWQYNSARPITMIRYLAGLGQSSDSTQPSYSADGLALVPGQIELITAQSSATGQRHAALASSVGQIAVKSWLGTPPNASLTSGVGWILGVNWFPYQRETFVTPAFPGFISGHSTFSRSAAEVLARYTGSSYFPGGLASYNFAAGTGLGFEAGPSASVQLQWATYFDAADQAGLSRLFGGIHISADDFTGRRTGSKVGADAFTKFLQLYNPAVGALPVLTQQPEAVVLSSDGITYFQVIAVSPQALSYQWQRKPNGQTAWADVANGGSYSGATTPVLTIAANSGNTSGDSYRVNVTNPGGTVTSDAATWSITGSPDPAPAPAPAPAPTPAPSGGGGGGGGGAPSNFFYVLLLALSAVRWLSRRRS